MTEVRAVYDQRVTMTIRISESLRRELKIVCAMEGNTINLTVNRLINEYLRDMKQKRNGSSP